MMLLNVFVLPLPCYARALLFVQSLQPRPLDPLTSGLLGVLVGGAIMCFVSRGFTKRVTVK